VFFLGLGKEIHSTIHRLHKEQHSTNAIAKLVGCQKATVRNHLTNSQLVKKYKPRHKFGLTTQQYKGLCEHIHTINTTTLSGITFAEMCEYLKDTYNVDTSVSTMARYLKDKGWHHVNTKTAQKADEIELQQWHQRQVQQFQQDVSSLMKKHPNTVFLWCDESSISHTNNLKAKRGTYLHQRISPTFYIKKGEKSDKRYMIICTGTSDPTIPVSTMTHVASKGIGDIEGNPNSFTGTSTATTFQEYVDRYIVPTVKKLHKQGKHSCVVLDNATIHKSPKYNSLNQKNIKQIKDCLKAENVPTKLYNHINRREPLMQIAKTHTPQLVQNYTFLKLKNLGASILYTPIKTWKYMAVESLFGVIKAEVAKHHKLSAKDMITLIVDVAKQKQQVFCNFANKTKTTMLEHM